MGNRDNVSPSGLPEVIVRAGDAQEFPTLLFEAADNLAAVGEHLGELVECLQ